MSKRPKAKRVIYKPCRTCGCTERYVVGFSCPECAKVRSRKRMRKFQGLPEPTRPEPNKCECCGKAAVMCLDHDHKTGAFRGWLCHSCNTGIGLLGDTPDTVMRAVKYLCPS